MFKSKKALFKKAGIAAAGVVLLYLVVLLVTGLYINQHKGKVIAYVNQLCKDNFEGEASIKDIDVSVWKQFPLIAFTVVDFSLRDSLYRQPAISLNAVSTSFNIFQVIFSAKTIRNIKVEHGTIHLFVDSSGYNNNYLLALKKKKLVNPSKAAPGEINIDNLSLSDLDLIIENKVKSKEISLLIKGLDASVSQSGNLMDIHMQEDVMMKKGLGFNLVKGAYLESQAIQAKWNLQFDVTTKKLSISSYKSCYQ